MLLGISCSKKGDPPDPATDIDGNVYKTVKIGSQIWMAENLRTTRYNNDTEIPLITDASTWGTLTTPGFCWYNNDELTYKETYGALYNGYAINSDEICPEGWHIPTMEEWQKLRIFLGDSAKAGGQLKESGTTHWSAPNKGADNISGFTALPAGIRYFEGTYSSVSYFTSFWSGTEVGMNDEWYLSLYFGDTNANIDYLSKNHGFSVRCIQD